MTPTTKTLSKSQLKTLNDHYEVIDEFKINTAKGMVVAGQSLIAIRELLPHGEFLPEIAKRGYSRSDAYRLMDVANRFGKFPRLGNLDVDAIRLLAPSAPAAEEAKAKAIKGFRVLLADAKLLMAKHKQTRKKRGPRVAAVNGSAAALFTCKKCGGHEQDEDGDCVKCLEPGREPGDDTEALKAERDKRKNSGKEVISSKARKAASLAIGVVVRFLEGAKLLDQHRDAIDAIIKTIKGKP